MKFFEYPYVIITILVMFILLMGLIGLYFTIKSVKTAKSSSGKGFCGIGKIENDFEKAGSLRKNRSIVYVSVSLDGMQRLYPESKVNRMYDGIKRILFNHFCIADGEISMYGPENFVVFSSLAESETELCIERCFDEINDALVKHGAVNVVQVNFGYYLTGATDVPF